MKYKRIRLGEKEVYSENLEEKVVDKGENSNFNLSGLLPWSTYTIHISAFNMFRRGKLKSPPTDQFKIETRVCGKSFIVLVCLSD